MEPGHPVVVRRRRGAAGGTFFQAEDGIRYSGVTGVQTCALPILFSKAGGDEIETVAGFHRADRGRLRRGGVVAITGPVRRGRPRPSWGECGGGRGARRDERRGQDRKRVGEGKRVDLGGRRIIKKK